MKIIRLAGRTYIMRPFTINQTDQIIKSLGGYNVEKLEDIPDVLPRLVETVSIALYLSPFKRFLLKRRLTNKASVEKLIEAISFMIEAIPTGELYSLSHISNQLKKSILK